MDLDNYVKVLCLSDANTVKGLQWAFDRSVVSARRFRLFPGTLAQIPELNLGEIDLALMTVDLGQPVPVENLKKLKKLPGLSAFVQPTPAQLLSLADLPSWSAIHWDGADYEKLARQVDQLADRHDDELRTKDFLETCRAWVISSAELPGLVELVNPPSNWGGSRAMTLEKDKGAYTVGAMQSKCDICLPVQGATEFGEFRFSSGLWIYRSRVASIPSRLEALKPGDHIDIEDYTLRLKMWPKAEEFLQIARRYNVVAAAETTGLAKAGESVADLCRELLYSNLTGELRIQSGLRSGSIFFADGVMAEVVTGAVNGKKALLRMLPWEKMQWQFLAEKRPQRGAGKLMMNVAEFTTTHQTWKKAWNRVKSLVPPLTIRLNANAAKFNAKSDWSARECQVLASISEYHLVRDVLNNCPLVDVDIFDTMVGLRRQALIEPAPQAV